MPSGRPEEGGSGDEPRCGRASAKEVEMIDAARQPQRSQPL